MTSQLPCDKTAYLLAEWSRYVTSFFGDAENARPENDGQKQRGLENAGLENDGQTSGHSRFCAQCADAVAVMPNGCPLCRTPIDMVMRVYF